MPYSPLISKIRCHNPNRIRSSIANKNYLTYIATREGVDINTIKDINDLLRTENIIDNIDLDDDIVHKEADNDQYLRYMSERPRSHGLFGNIDTSNLNDIAKQVSTLTKQGNCIYRGIISLSQIDAENLGFTEINNWNTYMHQVMPDIAKELGVSMTNFTWVAAFHSEKTHPHVHYELWDNTNKIKSPFIHTSVQIKCREYLSDAMFTNEYECMVKELYKSERDELNTIRNRSRKDLTDSIKYIMNDIDLYVPGITKNTLPDRISKKELIILSKDLTDLVNILPEHGSIDYAYQNVNVKEKVDKINSILLDRLDMQKELYLYLKAVEEGQKIIGKTKFDIAIAKEKAQKDINTRIGNIVLKRAKVLCDYKNTIDLNLKSQDQSISYKENNNLEIVDTDLSTNDFLSYNNNEIEDDIKFELYDNNIKEDNYFSESNNAEYYFAWNNKYKEAFKYLYDKDNQNFDLAFQLLEKEASLNNVLAINDLATIYKKGLGREVNIDFANSYFAKAFDGFKKIEKLNPQKYIEYRLGKMYYDGVGTDKNEIKGIEYLEKAAKLNDVNAQYQLGKIYCEGAIVSKNVFKGIDFFKAAGNQNNEYAQYTLGKIYSDSKTNIYNINEAISWFSKSADQKNQFAQYQLGKIYYEGSPLVTKDINKAIEFLKSASDQNNQFAQYTLGKIYADSSSSFYNMQEAFSLFKKSAEQGNQFAQYQVGKIYYDGAIVEKNIDKAIEFFKTASNQNNEYAQYTLGKIYADPESKHFNIHEAVSWYTKAAKQENQFAQYQLGKLYYEGTIVDKNLNMSIEFLKAASNQKNDFAQYTLGKIYSDPESEHFNIQEAVLWFTKSAELGNQYSQYKLGSLYLWGKHLEKNEELGLYWLNKSINQGNQYAMKTLEYYENYKNMTPVVAFGMVKVAYNMLSQQKPNTVASINDKQYMSKSKQALKEKALQQKVPGSGEED